MNLLHRSLQAGLLLLAINLNAQESAQSSAESARVYHLEGTDFALTLRGGQSVITADMITGAGINLERSGTIHTGAGTFLELQLIPSGTVIKLSENTSLVYNGVDETGKFADLGLLYGRIRVVTGGIYPLVIRSGGVSARIEDADVGVDYFLEPGSWNSSLQPLFRLYVFRGGAELFPYGRGGTSAYFGGGQSLTVGAGECLSLDISSSYTFAERTTVNRDIQDYWKLHYFEGSPPQPMPDTAIAGLLQDLPASPADEDTAVKYVPIVPSGGEKQPATINNRGKNICLAVGLALTVGSVVVQGVSFFQYEKYSERKYRDLFYWAYPSLGVGLITTLAGIIYNPRQ